VRSQNERVEVDYTTLEMDYFWLYVLYERFTKIVFNYVSHVQSMLEFAISDHPLIPVLKKRNLE
jgi:hypothetical protein